MTREQIEALRGRIAIDQARSFPRLTHLPLPHDEVLALLAAAERALVLEDVLEEIVEEWTAVASKLTCDVDYVGPLRAAIDRVEGK